MQRTPIIILRMRTVLRFVWMSLVLIIVALASALITMRLAIHGREVAVPNFQGKSPSEARRMAEASGLGVQVEREYYSATIPEGRVVSQAPPAGAVVRRGWEVRLALSAGAQRAAIPQVVGESERAASIAIAQRGLQLGVGATVDLPGASPGQVLAQNPPANATDATAPKISLLVAADAAPDAYVMPSFVGQPLGSVTLALKEAGFALGKVTTAAPPAPNPTPTETPSTPPKTPAGNAPQVNPAVNNTGPAVAPVTVSPLPPPSPASMVVSQEPMPGQKVLQGSAINFVVR
jgi:eukaryotic-like serine/threonine-protein kinase